MAKHTFPKVLGTKVTWASTSHSAMLGMSSLAQVSQNPGAQVSISLCLVCLDVTQVPRSYEPYLAPAQTLQDQEATPSFKQKGPAAAVFAVCGHGVRAACSGLWGAGQEEQPAAVLVGQREGQRVGAQESCRQVDKHEVARPHAGCTLLAVK